MKERTFERVDGEYMDGVGQGPFIIVGTDVYHMTTGLLCAKMASHDKAQEFVIIASRDPRWRTDRISFLRETMRGYAVAIKQHINGCVLNPQARRRLKHVGIVEKS